MKKTVMWARTGVVGAAVLGAACSTGSGHDDAGGSTEVLAVTSSALSADVTGVNVSISGAGIAPTMTTTLVKIGNKFQGTVTGIPAGAIARSTATASMRRAPSPTPATPLG